MIQAYPAWVLSDLARSGLTAIHAKKMQIIVANIPNPSKGLPPPRGYHITYFAIDGAAIDFHRTRMIDDYFLKGHKKPVRYVQPPNSSPHLYLYPGNSDWAKIARDPSVDVWIVEGEKKAVAMCELGIPTIAVGGVWAWLVKDSKEEDSEVVPEFASFVWRGRKVFIGFDSDAAYKPQILRAQDALKKEIVKRGGRPWEKVLPTLPGQEKTGADDFIVARGKTAKADLMDLPEHSLFLGYEISGAGILTAKFKKEEWPVQGFISPGLNMLIGAPKRGKTFLAHQVAIAVATGQKFLGVFPTGKPKVVVYLALEDTYGDIQDRLRLLRAAGSLGELDKLFFYAMDQWPIDPEEGLAALREILTYDHADCSMLIVDTLKNVYTPAEKGKNAYHHEYEVTMVLKRLAATHNLAIVVLHHDNKSAQVDMIDMASGSRGLTAGVDNVITLSRKTHEALGIVGISGRRGAEQNIAFAFDKGTWSYKGPANEVVESALQNLILDTIGRTGERIMGPTEIAILVGKTKSTIAKCLAAMERVGLVQNERGKYKSTITKGTNKY